MKKIAHQLYYRDNSYWDNFAVYVENKDYNNLLLVAVFATEEEAQEFTKAKKPFERIDCDIQIISNT